MVGTKPSSHTPESVLSLAGPELARAVYRTADALLANTIDAEEVTLDVLVALRKKLGEIGDDGLEGWLQTLPAWLDRAAVSKAKGRAAKRKHHASTLAELTTLAAELGTAADDSETTAKLVREVLAYLPRRHRFVFVLKYGLGHTDADIAELAGLDTANVTRTLAAVEHKLREYAAHHPLPAAMIKGMAPGVEDNPLRHYMELYGRANDVTEARIRRRFEAWLRDDPSGLELSGDHSFHDHSFSGTHFRVEDLVSGNAADARDSTDSLDDETERELVVDSEPTLDGDPVAFALPQRRIGGWVFGTVASVAVLALALAQVQLNTRLEHISDKLAEIAAQEGRLAAAPDGPVLLEPGEFVALAHDSRAEPAKDATVEMLRNDERGAEFRLTAGSIAFHVKPAQDVEWVVHDGRYDISTASSRFRVVHNGSVPDVQVFDGKVHVVGGLLGAEGIEVSSSQYSLAAAMRARGEVPVAELTPYAAVDPKDLAALATDEVYGRALALRVTDAAKAVELLREIVDRGDDDWVSEMAFEQLRTLVDPEDRAALQVAYEQRFHDGEFAEAFAAIRCQAVEDADERQGCWTEFGLTYPHSLFGP